MAYSYNNQSNMEEKLQYTNGATPSGTLTGLLKGSTYKVVVYGRNSGLYRSPPSNEVSFTTSTTGNEQYNIYDQFNSILHLISLSY